MFNLPSIYSARKSLNHKLSINHKISHDTNLHKIKQKTCTHALPLSCCRATSDRLPLCLYFVDHQASIQCHTDFLITSLKASSICGRHLPITAMLSKRLPEKSVRGMRWQVLDQSTTKDYIRAKNKLQSTTKDYIRAKNKLQSVS